MYSCYHCSKMIFSVLINTEDTASALYSQAAARISFLVREGWMSSWEVCKPGSECGAMGWVWAQHLYDCNIAREGSKSKSLRVNAAQERNGGNFFLLFLKQLHGQLQLLKHLLLPRELALITDSYTPGAVETLQPLTLHAWTESIMLRAKSSVIFHRFLSVQLKTSFS